MKKNIFVLICITSLILIGSCSTAPKRPTQITDIRRLAEQELELGNKASGQGQYDNALLLLTEAKRKAVSVDDSSLIIRTTLSRGNLLLLIDKPNEAFAEWDAAIAEAQRIGNAELLSVSRIFRARGSLLTGRDTARNVLDLVTREHSNIKDRYFLAFSWQLRGLAYRAMESTTDAENALRRSLEIHEKDRYLEDASYDWYIIASVRSLAGNYNGAIQALESSMSIDRRIENTWGLVASWKAMGDIYAKMGRASEANAAYARANAIAGSR